MATGQVKVADNSAEDLCLLYGSNRAATPTVREWVREFLAIGFLFGRFGKELFVP
jgi:hypothetical protein